MKKDTIGNREYTPEPIDISGVTIPSELEEAVHFLAQNNHDKWAKNKIDSGFSYGESNDADQKKNPYLKPYLAMNDDERQSDVNSAEAVIKLLMKKKYSIKEAKMTWKTAKYCCFGRYYGGSRCEPVYRAPLVISLVGQNYPDGDRDRLLKRVDAFVRDMFRRFGLECRKQSNDERETPVYALSTLETNSERDMAEYISEHYGIQVLHVTDRCSRHSSTAAYRILLDDGKDGYIIRNSFIMLTLWDGISKQCRAGRMVREAILETDPSAAEDMISSADTVISETHPVYQIVLPSCESSKAGYKARLLLPYTLDSGKEWYTLNRTSDHLTNGMLVGDTEYLVISGRMKRECKKDVAALRAERRKAVRAARRDNLRSWQIKKIKKQYKNQIKRRKQRAAYHVAVEQFKKKRFADNIRMITYINSNLLSGIKRADKEEAYDLLKGSGRDIHGRVLSADALNMRHLRLDMVATAQQKRHRIQSIWIAICAALGLSAYGVFSDIVSAHSLIGILGGILSSVLILIALILFGLSRLADDHGTHVSLRLLSEGLRIKTFLNAAGMADRSVDSYFTERQGIDLEWAQIILRGWNVVDRAQGFYDTDKDSSVSLDDVKVLWLGSSDTETKDITKYSPSRDGQLAFARKRGNEFGIKSAKQNRYRTCISVLVVVLTFFVTIFAAFNFASSVALSDPETWSDLASERYFGNDCTMLIESLLVFFIGSLPAVGACYLMYKESKRFDENAKRYKWMATKYQKLISCFDPRTDVNGNICTVSDAEKRVILDAAARTAAEEIAEWTALIADSDINLPF